MILVSGVRKAFEKVLEVGKQKVSEENLADFGFRSESNKTEKFAISARAEKNASICCSTSKGMFQEHWEKDSDEGLGQHSALNFEVMAVRDIKLRSRLSKNVHLYSDF